MGASTIDSSRDPALAGALCTGLSFLSYMGASMSNAGPKELNYDGPGIFGTELPKFQTAIFTGQLKFCLCLC